MELHIEPLSDHEAVIQDGYGIDIVNLTAVIGPDGKPRLTDYQEALDALFALLGADR